MSRYSFSFLFFWGLFCQLTLSETISKTNIGFMFPIQLNGLVHPLGPAALSGAMMAVEEINNKADGLSDSLIPDTQINMLVRSPLVRFTYGAVDAINMMYRSDNLAVSACIGPFSLAATTGAAPAFAENSIPVIGYHERSSILGKSATYANYLRTVPAFYQDSHALCDVLEYFKWYRVSVFYTNDEAGYGAASSYFFSVKAPEVGVEILSVHAFLGGADTTSVVQEAKRIGAYVFVLLMHVPDAIALLRTGYELNLFHDGTQIVGGEHLSIPYNWDLVKGTNRKHGEILKGFIGVRYNDRYIYQPELDAAFKERWYARNNTNRVMQSDKSVMCDDTLDISGETHLYQFYPNLNTSLSYECAGFNYSTTTEDQFVVARHAYDAVYAVAHGLHGVIVEDSATEVTGSALYEYLLTRLSFIGLTGNVSFSTTYQDISLDVGGRMGDVSFEIVHYHRKADDGDDDAIQFDSIMTWTMQNDVVDACESPGDTSCLDLAFNTLDNSKPLDRPILVIEDMPLSYKQLLVALTTIVLVYVAFIAIVLFMTRNRRMVKITQPMLSGIIILGGVFACIRVYLNTMPLSDSICSVMQWMSHLSYCSAFVILLLKLWRVNVVAGGMTKRAVSLGTVLKMFGALSFISIALLVAIQVTGVGVKLVTVVENQFDFIQQRGCEVHNRPAYYALSAYEVLVLLLSLRYCYVCRNVASTVSDTKSIVNALLSVIVVAIVCYLLAYGSGFDPLVCQLLICLGFIVATCRVMFVLFNDLVVKVLLGYDMDRGLKMVQESWSVMNISVVKHGLAMLGISNERKRVVSNATGELDSKTLAKFAKLKNIDMLNDEVNATKKRIQALDNEVACLENMRFALEDDDKSSHGSSVSKGESEVDTISQRKKGGGDKSDVVSNSFSLRGDMSANRIAPIETGNRAVACYGVESTPLEDEAEVNKIA